MQLPYDHRSVANTDTRGTPTILGRGCFYISLWRPVRGERAERLTKTLLGAKHGGQHRQGVRIGVDECASYDTTLRLSYAKLRQYGTWSKIQVPNFGPGTILS